MAMSDNPSYPSKPQPPSFANLHPPVKSNNEARQQGLGIGRDSKTPGIISKSDLNQGQTKFFTDCQKEYLASINCRLEHHDHKLTNICQPLFDNYKACRVEENKRRLEENAKGNSIW